MLTLAEPKTSVINNGRKQVTSKFTDGSEMIEEYDVITDDLLLRKCRGRNTLGGFTPWVIEVGTESRARNLTSELLVETSGSPEVVRQDTKEAHVIRIRNVPYPREVFAVSVERREGDPIGEIVVRTSNKKYFKRITLPEMTRAAIPLDQTQLKYDVKHNTLVIEYKKHLAVLAAEAAAKKERAALPAKRCDDTTATGCPQQ